MFMSNVQLKLTGQYQTGKDLSSPSSLVSQTPGRFSKSTLYFHSLFFSVYDIIDIPLSVSNPNDVDINIQDLPRRNLQEVQ